MVYSDKWAASAAYIPLLVTRVYEMCEEVLFE